MIDDNLAVVFKVRFFVDGSARNAQAGHFCFLHMKGGFRMVGKLLVEPPNCPDSQSDRVMKNFCQSL